MKKLFVIASRLPYPLDKGDKLRLYHQINQLKEYFEIHLCCINIGKVDQHAIDHLKGMVNELYVYEIPKWKVPFHLLRTSFNSKPFQVNYFYSFSIHTRIKKLIKQIQPDHIFCQLIRAAEYVKEEHQIPKTIDYQDAFSKGIERRIEKSGWLKWVFRSEHRRLVRYENLVFEYFENKIIISEEDRKFIMHQDAAEISIVENGIDIEFFKRVNPGEKLYDAAFVGNMSYAPNVDCVVHFCNDILPIILKSKPNFKFCIAGSSPTKEVLNLRSDNVKITGWVEDIRDSYNHSKVFVAPLQIGTGLQNKLLEAMSLELPCVISPLAQKPLQAENGKEIIVAKTNEQFANEILGLLDNEQAAKHIGLKAREFVAEKYSWKRSTGVIVRLIEK